MAQWRIEYHSVILLLYRKEPLLLESGLTGAHRSIHITLYQLPICTLYCCSITDCLALILDNSRSRLETYPGTLCIYLDRVLNPPQPHSHIAWR